VAEQTIFDKPIVPPMSDHLLRQRRNLIITCVLLWVLKYGGITISKFSLGGFEVAIKNPAALTLALWLAFFYFLYRYAQYFYTEGCGALTQVLDAALDERCAPRMRKIVEEKHPESDDFNQFNYKLLKTRNWLYQGQCLRYETAAQVGEGRHQDIEMPIKRGQLRAERVSAYWHTFVVHNVGTDYILPFLLAAFVLLYYSLGMGFA
jgi:hypothetical protein